tara:strand:- start:363 stop:617 length:255 start_codon:yes stop_codon:yes gene_type:complete
MWQYRWGKRFITIYSPNNKRYNIELPDFFTALYGEDLYEEKRADTEEWANYSWDKSVSPSDFDLDILDFTPSTVKSYIINHLVR